MRQLFSVPNDEVESLGDAYLLSIMSWHVPRAPSYQRLSCFLRITKEIKNTCIQAEAGVAVLTIRAHHLAQHRP